MLNAICRSAETQPASPGLKKLLLVALLPILFAACNKDSGTPSSDAAYFFVGKLDGTTLRYEVTGTNDTEMATSNDGSIGPPDCTFGYGCAIGSFDSGQPYFSVDFPNLFSGDCGDEQAVFSTLFHSGAWSFGNSQGTVVVSFFDGAEMWSSAGGAQASNAVFNVSGAEFRSTPFGVYMTLRGTVSCTLYHDSGASKKLEAGSFCMSFRRYF